MSSQLVASLVLLAASTTATVAVGHPSTPPAKAAGSVTGHVTFTGTPPKMKPIDMAKEPSCAKQHATPLMNESVVTGANNALGNVVVYVSAGDQGASPSTQAVRYDQKGCEYIPHVAVLEVKQPLDIYNDDQTSHNIHPLAKSNPEWNKSQPPGAPPIHASYDKAEFIPVKCNIHPWMHGYFAVLQTPHHALSKDDGSFTLEGLPPGKYTLTAWHERFGTQTQDVTVAAGKPATADFVMKAVPY
jgi:Carboxypeptidase regulatory-like domain